MQDDHDELEIDLFIFSAHVINRMRTVVIAYLGVLPIQYPLGENAETCNFLSNKSCPVEQDEIVKYTLRLPIEDYMPVVSCSKKAISPKNWNNTS